MRNFNYNVNTYGENDEATFRTNDVRDAIDSFFKAVDCGIKCDLLNGFTGEVLAIANNPDHEDYTTAEMGLMMLGWLMEQELSEDTIPEVPVALPNPDSAEEGLMEFLDRMVAEGMAVKLS